MNYSNLCLDFRLHEWLRFVAFHSRSTFDSKIDKALTQFDQETNRLDFSYQPLGAPDIVDSSHMYATLDSQSPVTSWHEYIYTQKALTDCLTFTFAFSILSPCTQCQYPLTKNLMLQIMH